MLSLFNSYHINIQFKYLFFFNSKNVKIFFIMYIQYKLIFQTVFSVINSSLKEILKYKV
jgi:hypothetical protein